MVKVTKRTITCPPRKLKAKWTMEAARDLIHKPPKWLPKSNWPNLPKQAGIVPNTIYDYIKEKYYEWYSDKYGSGVFHGLALEKELMEALSQEIVKEIDDELIKDLLEESTKEEDARQKIINKYKNQIEDLQREELEEK